MAIQRKASVMFVLSFAFVGFCSVMAHPCMATESNTPDTIKKGIFYLIGTGPGDSDLATTRALQTMKAADLVICYENLKEKFVDYLKEKEVFVIPMGVWIWHGYGKKASDFKGEELERFQKSKTFRNQVLSRARAELEAGKKVAVLASGDPLIYCPWAWMLNEFKEYNTQVVPGLSAFNVGAAALKKQVTAGTHTKSVILTMTDLPEMAKRDTIEKLSTHQATMVVFMPFVLNQTPKMLVDKLIEHYPPETPIAIVMHAGCKGKEQVLRGTLNNICSQVDETQLPFATLVYVGDFLDNVRSAH